MIALLLIGTALLVGIGMRIAAVSGAVWLVPMWTASLPRAKNLFQDDQLVYASSCSVSPPSERATRWAWVAGGPEPVRSAATGGPS